MKQRIRGLVSLHEIPFSSCALQREEGNWPHYTKRGRDGGVGGGGERQRGIAKILLDLSFFMFPLALLCIAAASPVTSHLSIQEALFLPFLSLFGRRGREERGAGGRGKSDIGLETCYCLASRTASQPGGSVREREREKDGVKKRGRDGCHGYFPGDASTLVYLLAEGARTVGPIAEQMYLCVFVCPRLFIKRWVCV